MALFGNTENNNSDQTNPHYIEFINSQRASQEELRELKRSIFEFTRSLHDLTLNTSRENSTAFRNLAEQLNPPGRDARTFSSTTLREREAETNTDLLDTLKNYIKESNAAKTGKGLLDEIGTLVVTGLLALVALPFIGPIIKWFDENFGTDLKSKFDKITAPFSQYVDGVWNVIDTLKGWALNAIDWFGLLLSDPKEAINEAWLGLKNLGNRIYEFLKPAMIIGEDVFRETYDYLKEHLTIYFNEFLAFIRGTAGADNVFQNTYDRIKTYFDSFTESIENWSNNNGLGDMFQTMKLYFNQMYESARGLVTELFPLYEGSSNFFKTTIDLLKNVLDSGVIQQKIDNIILDITESIKAKATSMWDAVMDAMSGVITDLKNKLLINVFGDAKEKKQGSNWDWFGDIDLAESMVPGLKEAREARTRAKKEKEEQDNYLNSQGVKSNKELRDKQLDARVQELRETNPILDKVLKAVTFEKSADQLLKDANIQAQATANALKETLSDLLSDKPSVIVAPGADTKSAGTITPVPTTQPSANSQVRSSWWNVRPSANRGF